ncbi:hypothetical protein BCR36DRAFT_453612 [Piromyces finnis]|uniref:Uncharacterized protein n=1 Tax=Piromyces finnis TaxID=1754191 RepID=A0A1Y1VL55_9FUNG|nr:hypothetical protein BCR36DRAFT_453612 [Piromyces finnis]|eukprot:ORX59181.1 hypothetical protein BCR36DRAFT_453612 [Piromyces finnis]
MNIKEKRKKEKYFFLYSLLNVELHFFVLPFYQYITEKFLYYFIIVITILIIIKKGLYNSHEIIINNECFSFFERISIINCNNLIKDQYTIKYNNNKNDILNNFLHINDLEKICNEKYIYRKCQSLFWDNNRIFTLGLNSLYSDVNNFFECSLLNDQFFNDYYGFTENGHYPYRLPIKV